MLDGVQGCADLEPHWLTVQTGQRGAGSHGQKPGERAARGLLGSGPAGQGSAQPLPASAWLWRSQAGLSPI